MRKLFFLLLFLLVWCKPAQATEIMISSYTVDNPSFSLPAGTTTCKLRIYLDRTFLTGGSTGAGRQLQAGSPPTGKFYQEVLVTIGTRITPTGNTIPIATISQFTIDSTTDGFDLKTAKFSAYFYSNTGSQLAIFGGFDRFSVPPLFDTGVTATWAQIRMYNASGAPINIATDTYTKEVIDAKIAAVTGITNPMTTMGDLIVGGMSGQPARLPFSSGATARFLKQTGTSTITTTWATLTSGDITTPLGFTPLNKAGDTMTGLLILSGDPAVALGAATKQYVDARAGITSLNGLTASSFPSQTFAVGGNFPNLTIGSSAGAHTFNWTGQLSVIRGGTGLATVTTGDILYASGSNTLSALAAAASGNALLSGATPTWGKIALTTHVSGILPSTNGGTNNAFFQVAGPSGSIKTYTFPDQTTTILTTASAITAVQGGTGFTSYTTGDLLYADSGTTLAKRGIGSSNQSLTVSGGLPVWSLISLTAGVSGVLPVANGGSGQSSFAAGFLKSNGTTISSQAVIDLAGGGTNASSFLATNGVVYVGSTSLLGTALGASGTIFTGTGGVPAFTTTPTATSLTLSGITANSIVFAGTAGLLSQNNARLFWDNTALPSGGLKVQDSITFLGATSGSVGWKAPGTLGDGTIYSMPAAKGSNDQVLTLLDATTATTTWKSASSLMTGITTINGEDGPTITFATGTTGTDFALVVTTDTLTFNIPSAGSGISRGLITNGVQTIFGAKSLNDPLTLAAGTTTTTPLVFQAGVVLTSAVPHTLEWDGSHAFLTKAGPTSRQQIAYTTAVGSETVALATSIAGNLTGDVTSVAMVTSYSAIVPRAKGGIGAALPADLVGTTGFFIRSDGATPGTLSLSADGSGLTSLNATNIASGTLDNARLSGVELTANKNAVSGYAGLDGSTKLSNAQGAEVWSVTDLSDYTAVSGTGTTALRTTITSVAVGDIITRDAFGNWINSPAGAASAHNLLSATHTDTLAASCAQGSIIIGNATPAWSAKALGAAGTVLHVNGSTADWLPVTLPTDVTGVLGFVNGGTGSSFATATALFNGIDPLTTKGDVITHDGTNSVRQGVGTNGFALVADSAQTNGIKWAAVGTVTHTVAALTANSFIFGNGTDDIKATAAATNGQLLIGSTSANPVAAALTAAQDVAITNGAGSITIGRAVNTDTGAYFLLPNGYAPGNGVGVSMGGVGQVRVYRFYLPVRLTITSIDVRVTTLFAASTGGAGIYSADGNTLLCSGTVATATTGTKNITVSSTTLGPGFYLYALTDTSVVVVFNGCVIDTTDLTVLMNSGTAVIATAANTSTVGVLPATTGALTPVNAAVAYAKIY